MNFSVSSWNVNGARKLKPFFQNQNRAFVQTDVFMLQETWIADESEQLVLCDFIAFHEAAVPANGRNVMGLSSFFRLTTFSGGTMEQLQSPLPWVLAVRWLPSNGKGVIFVNIYAAIHTQGVLQSDVDELCDFFDNIQESFGRAHLSRRLEHR
jgi:exonuclease III